MAALEEQVASWPQTWPAQSPGRRLVWVVRGRGRRGRTAEGGIEDDVVVFEVVVDLAA